MGTSTSFSKVLLICQRFPPYAGAAGRRLGMVAEAWRDKGEVHVIRKGQPSPKDRPGVISISVNDIRSVAGVNGTYSPNPKSKEWLSSLLKLRQAFPFLLITDDGGPLYRRKAYQKACDLIEKHGITTVFSSFRPWSDHLVAAKLKRRFPQLKWIADFRDLPVDPVHKNVWWPALQRWWGKRVIRSADEVWVVSKGQGQQLKGWHPNISVKYNALEELPPSHTAPLSEYFTIVYTGSLYPELRTPQKLVEILRRLLSTGAINKDMVRLIYRGKDDAYFRQFTEELPEVMLDIKTTVDSETAHKLQGSAQILLLLTWSAPDYYGVLTAKLWEYLATGRPILALVKGPGDPELKNIIGQANAGEVFADSELDTSEQWLLTAYKQWAQKGAVIGTPDLLTLEKYLAKSIL